MAITQEMTATETTIVECPVCENKDSVAQWDSSTKDYFNRYDGSELELIISMLEHNNPDHVHICPKCEAWVNYEELKPQLIISRELEVSF